MLLATCGGSGLRKIHSVLLNEILAIRGTNIVAGIPDPFRWQFAHPEEISSFSVHCKYVKMGVCLNEAFRRVDLGGKVP